MMGKISMACSARMLSSRTSRRAWVFWGGGGTGEARPAAAEEANGHAGSDARGTRGQLRTAPGPPRGARLREAGLMEDKGHDFTPTWNI